MLIRRLTADDAEVFWQFRMTALESDPWSFVESPEELKLVSPHEYTERLRTGGAENFVMGAFDGPALVGTVGFYRETPVKRRHKGWIWGVFVARAARVRGVGRDLMAHTIAAAKSLPGLEMILLTVSVSTEPAKRLYQSLGFRSIGIEPRGLKIGAQAKDEEHLVLDFLESKDLGTSSAKSTESS